MQMMHTKRNSTIDDVQRLPVFHRTIKMDASLWQAIKAHSKRSGKPIRQLVDEALDAELPKLIAALNRLGLNGERPAGKLVRLPMDDNVVGRINSGRRGTGVPATRLLLMCLKRHHHGSCRLGGGQTYTVS
jgi:hypothetical protein